MDNKIKISVVIPVYNAEKYLVKCLDSAINQTLKEIEIICINDGSTDNSLLTLIEYEKKDSRIKIIDKENEGAGVTKNRGIEICSGEYIHFLDSDDYLELDAYNNLYDIAKKHNADMVKGKSFTFDDISNKRIVNQLAELQCLDLNDFDKIMSFYEQPEKFLNISVTPWSGIYRKELVIENEIFFSDLVATDDMIFYYKSIIYSKKVVFLDKYIYNYRTNSSTSLMGSQYAKHFYCYFVTFRMVVELCNNIGENYKHLIINRALASIFYGFNQYKVHPEYGYIIKLQTKEFYKSIGFELNTENGKLKKL